MTEIKFFDHARNEALKYAVIAARQDGKWLFCRHKERTSWELPGGHREPGENIYDTARRELWEETGATDFQLEPVSAYSVTREGETDCGALFFAELREMGPIPEAFEIAETRRMDTLPEDMTYPEIQPALMECVSAWLAGGNFRDEQEDLFELLF